MVNNTLTFVGLAISTTFVYFGVRFLWKIYRIDSWARASGVPTYTRKPFLWGDATAFKNPNSSHITFFELAKDLGSVFFIRIVSTPVLVIADPAVAQYVMTTRNFPKSSWVYKAFGGTAPTNLVGINGSEHKRIRRQVMPAFNIPFLKQQVPIIVDRSLLLMKQLENLIGQDVDMSDWFHKTTLDVIGLLGFGYDFRLVETGDEGIRQMINRLIGNEGTFLMMDPTAFWRRNHFDKGYITQKQRFDEIAMELIRKGRRERDAGETVDSEKFGKRKEHLNILNLLVKTEFKNEEQPLTDQELIDQIITFLFAGSETSSHTLGFCLGQLSKDARVLSKLRAEIDAALDSFQSLADITYDTVNSLKYLECFIKEVLRVTPIATATVRECDGDNEIIAGFPVPRGTWLFVSYYAMHHSKDLWTEPERFWPERFEQETIEAEEAAGKKRHPYLYTPFAAGPRACIGMTIAQIEIKILLVHFLRHFDWDPVKCDPSNFGGTVTLKMDDCIIKLRKRVRA